MNQAYEEIVQQIDLSAILDLQIRNAVVQLMKDKKPQKPKSTNSTDDDRPGPELPVDLSEKALSESIQDSVTVKAILALIAFQ